MMSTDTLHDDFDRFVAGDPAVERYGLFKATAGERHGRCSTAPRWTRGWSPATTTSRSAIGDESRFDRCATGPGAPMYGDGDAAVERARAPEEGRGGRASGCAARARWPRSTTSSGPPRERLADEVVAKDGVVDLKTEYAMWIPLLVIGELLDVEGAGGVPATGTTTSQTPASPASATPRTAREVRGPRGAGRLPGADPRRPPSSKPGDDLLSDLCTMTYDGRAAAGVADQGHDRVPAHGREWRPPSARCPASSTTSSPNPERWREFRDHPELGDQHSRRDAARVPADGGPGAPGAAWTSSCTGPGWRRGDTRWCRMASANRDADLFDQPDKFLLDRFADDAERQFTNASEILPFGAGRHHCAGSQLARMEMLHASLTELARVASGRVSQRRGRGPGLPAALPGPGRGRSSTRPEPRSTAARGGRSDRQYELELPHACIVVTASAAARRSPGFSTPCRGRPGRPAGCAA